MISDSSITPLRAGTLAQIGQLSLTGVSNRFVALTPGGGAPVPSGGTLPLSQTRGIVDLDAVLDALTPGVRDQLRQVVRAGGYLMSGGTPGSLNRLVAYLNPALSRTAIVTAQLAASGPALDSLVRSTSVVAGGLAAHTRQLTGAVSGAAGALREVASARSALQDALTRAPGTLGQATAVLRDTRYALGVVDPLLAKLRPAAAPLAALVRALAPAAAGAVPTVAALSGLVPGARRALAALPATMRRAIPAVQSLSRALGPIAPMLAGFRAYAPEIVAGFFTGFGGSQSGYFDANGHYLRVQPVLSGPQVGLKGALGLLGDAAGALVPLSGARSGLLARCPGAGTSPAAAGGNPWNQPGVPGICDAAQGQP